MVTWISLNSWMPILFVIIINVHYNTSLLVVFSLYCVLISDAFLKIQYIYI